MRNAFDPKLGAEAAEAFTFAGHAYKIGEPFPHRDLGVAPLELEGLWRAGRIRFVDPAPAPAADVDLEKLSAAQLAELERATAPAPSSPARPAAKPADRDRRPRR